MTYVRLAGQFAVIFLLFAAVAAFADWPLYRQFPAGDGVVVLAFVHSPARREECRRRSAAEIARLPPNMRRPQDCPRGRRTLAVELDVDGRTIYQADLPPTGIAGDGPARVYRRFVLPAGEHDIAVRMRDMSDTGFDHERKGRIALAPDQMFVIDFRADTGEFVFH